MHQAAILMNVQLHPIATKWQSQAGRETKVQVECQKLVFNAVPSGNLAMNNPPMNWMVSQGFPIKYSDFPARTVRLPECCLGHLNCSRSIQGHVSKALVKIRRIYWLVIGWLLVDQWLANGCLQ